MLRYLAPEADRNREALSKKVKMRQQQLTELRILVLAVILAAGAALPIGTVRVDAQTRAAAQLATPGLTAEAAPDGIILRWDAAADAVGYQLATWWNAETGWQTVGGGSLTGTSYTHTEVTAGTTYYYSIRALFAGNRTGAWLQDYPSATASTRWPAPVLTAAASASSVELSWSAIPGAALYQLWAWNEAGGWQLLDDALTVTRYSHADRAAGRIWYYTVRAIGADDTEGPWSEYAEASMPAITETPTLTPTLTPTPAAVEMSAPGLTAEATPDGIILRWDAAADAVGYQLATWWDAETGWQTVGGGSLTGTSYTHTGVSAGTTYYYSIRALFAGNRTGAWLQDYPSATARAAVSFTPTPVPAGALGQVQNLRAVVNGNEVTLSWDAMPGAVGYDLHVWDSRNPGTTTELSDALTSTTYTHRGLTEGGVYYYWVSAFAGKVYPGSPYSPGVPAVVYAAVFPNQIRAEIDGIRVITSGSQVIAQTRQVIAGMFKNRPDLIETLAGKETVIFFHKGILPPDYGGHAVPGGVPWWSIFVNSSAAPFGDEARPGGPPGGTERSCDILIHELAHLVQSAVEEQAGGDAFNARLRALYRSASEAGLWEDDYAATNYFEYWAVTVTFWFEQKISSTVAPPGTKLADHDPAIAQLIVEVFGADASVPPACQA